MEIENESISGFLEELGMNDGITFTALTDNSHSPVDQSKGPLLAPLSDFPSSAFFVGLVLNLASSLTLTTFTTQIV